MKRLDCGHELDEGKPAQVQQKDGTLKTVQGWQWVLRDGKKICHACDMLRVLDCGHNPSPHGEHTTGTAHTDDNKEICWECCAKADRQTMIDKGHSKNLPLYLSGNDVANWPGTLKFRVFHKTEGRHNIAGKRIDIWFAGPDGFNWHGYQLGDWTQIVHCKRTKERTKTRSV